MQQLVIIFLIVITSSYSYADNARVNFSGTVAAIPCVVDGTASVDVFLGNIPVETLDNSIVSTWTNFQLKLKNCPASTSVTATITGQQSPLMSSLFLNTGTATNVGAQIASLDTQQFITPQLNTVTRPIQADFTAVFNLAARAYSPTEDGAIPGTINTTLQVSFTYQ